MPRGFGFWTIVASGLFSASTAGASDYQVNVTRKGPQLYKLTGKDAYVSTRACFEFVYYEDAILRMSGKIGTIVFLDEGAKCDIKGVYGKTQLDAGTYTIRVTHETDDWYSIDGTEFAIRTMSCFEYWYGEEVILRVSANSAVIMDDDGESHSIEGIFVRLGL